MKDPDDQKQDDHKDDYNPNESAEDYHNSWGWTKDDEPIDAPG